MKIFSFNSERGVAILMVLTAVTLLSAILVDFTFESKINKIKVYNMQEKIQAKLNAEAGLKMALTRLEIYQQAYNMWQTKEEAKKAVNIEMLNQIWAIPFMYPIPSNDKMNIVQRTAIQDFEKKSLVQGEMRVNIDNLSGLINLNMLRILSKENQERKQPNNPNEEQKKEEDDEPNTGEDISVEKQLVDLLTRAFNRKKETDQDFFDTYSDRIPKQLISSIKFYVSDNDAYEDEYSPQFDANYQTKRIFPKHAPLSSLSELYTIDGWDDKLADLIKSEVTVHGVAVIDLNKINDKILKILIPNIDNDQIKAFFKYRDDPKDPHYFNSLEDFKKYIVTKARITSEQSFDERMKKYKKAGIQFGPGGSLFRVTATGVFNKAQYNLVAYVSLPAKPQAPNQDTNQANNPNKNQGKAQTPKDKDDEDDKESGKEKKPEEKKENPIELLPPRVVEILVN